MSKNEGIREPSMGNLQYTQALLASGTLTVNGSGTTQPSASSTPVSFNASPTSGQSPLAVSFNSNVGGPAYWIYFGDGQEGQSYAINTPCAGSSCSFGVPHTYTSAGTYTAKLLNSSNTVFGTATITVGGTTQPSATSTIPYATSTIVR
jgi:PKD repeat protein